MSTPSNEFGAYLAEDEFVVHGASGTLIDEGHDSEGAIGVTDRRVLFRSDTGRFVDVSHDAVYSIESRSRTRLTYRGVGCRLLAALGGLIAVAAFLALTAFGSSVSTFLLSSLAVVGAIGAEFVRREREGTGPHGSNPDVGRRDDGRFHRLRTTVANVGGSAVIGLGYVALLALVGLIAVTGSLVVLPLVLVTLGGVGLADVGLRRKRALDAIGGSRHREREVSLHLADGRHVRLRFDATEPIDRELSGVAREPAIAGSTTELASH